jgi:PadR family transcriptional regulator, regulatory protein PadR
VAGSKVETLVLGMLAEEPMYGYEVLERLRERGGSEWAGIARASVYQALQRLERDGYASARAESGREGPDRRRYRLTRAGRSRLRESILEGFDAEGPYETDAAVPLAFCHLLDPVEARDAIARREALVRYRIARLAEERARVKNANVPGRALAVRLLEEQEAFADAELSTLAAVRRDLSRSRR